MNFNIYSINAIYSGLNRVYSKFEICPYYNIPNIDFKI
jgi:hypothetical protein